MILSQKKNFIFVHVGKTAGSNIARALAPYGTQAHHHPMNRFLSRAHIKVTYVGPVGMRRFRRHCTARHARRFLPPSFFKNAFKFAFVRNPWDWLVSQYHFMLRKTSHHRHKRVRAMAGFAEFVEYEIRQNKRFQHPFVTDGKGEILVDFVGRFENLHDDFHLICRHLGIQAEIPCITLSDRREYRRYYDSRLCEKVAAHYHRDIALFEYSFDPRPLPPLLRSGSAPFPCCALWQH